MDIIPEAGWEGIAKGLVKRKGPVMLLGPTDSGKSTLAKYLIREILLRKSNVALVDSDIGQSSLGPPGTICMKIFDKTEDMDNFTFEEMFFIGDINPAENIPPVLEGVKKMVEHSQSEGIGIIVVDTSGLISGEAGKALKTGKIRAIGPRHIIALQHGDELELILSLTEGVPIYRLKPSRLIKRRSREDRIHYRSGKFTEYFKGSRSTNFPTKEVEFLHKGEPLDIRTVRIAPKSLVGMNGREGTIALGIFEELLSDRVIIKTPLISKQGVTTIILGNIIV